MRIEAWDVIGLAGFALLCVGLYLLVGGAWVAVLVGAVVTTIYAVRESRLMGKKE